jgi:ubiquinone/menaquinone biosynthesis C-methylase UbiE
MTRRDAIETLFQINMGTVRSACLHAAMKLEVADLLADGPKPVERIAEAAGVDIAMLYRVLRYLASDGAFEERPGREFALTPLSQWLRIDVEGSFHPFAVSNAESGFEVASHLLPAMQTGEIPFVRRFGQHPFAILMRDPARAALLERGWQGIHGPETPAVLDAYDFKGIRKLADIGGGHGDVLVAFLERDPSRTGAIFDIPPVVAQTKKRLEAAGLAARCELIAGDFFKEIPVDADAYFLRHILHDWNDGESRKILGNIAERCKTGNRVLIAECVIKAPNTPDLGKLLDMQMLFFLSGWERTEAEYRALLESTGFDFVGVVPTDSMISIVEGRFRG